jgi:hypothetical protein
MLHEDAVGGLRRGPIVDVGVVVKKIVVVDG